MYTMLYVLPNSWSQIGYYKSHAGTGDRTLHWAQINNGGSISDEFGKHLSGGQLYTYAVALGHWGIGNYIDGHIFTAVGTYFTQKYWTGHKWFLQFSEESYKYPSNVPGTRNKPATAYNMAYWPKHEPSVTWVAVDCGLINYVNNDPTHWGHHFHSCATQDLYTKNPY